VIDAGLTISGGMDFSRVSGFSVQEEHRQAILSHGVVPKKQKPPGRKAEGAGERDVSALALHKEQQSPVDHGAKGSSVLRVCHVRIRLAAGGPRYPDRQHD
jgi:hypothetical protein